MNFRTWPLLALCFASGLTLSVSRAAHADIVWERSYSSARAKSQASGKPLIIEIYTDWCPWCKRMDNETFPDAQVQEMSRHFVMLKLNAEKEGKADSKLFQVKGYPMVIFATPQGGHLLDQGFMDRGQMIDIMQYTLRRSGKTAVIMGAGGAVAPPPTFKPPIGPRRMSLVPGANYWKKQPELHRAVTSANYGGAFVLSDDGVVAIDKPTKKKSKAKPKSHR